MAGTYGDWVIIDKLKKESGLDKLQEQIEDRSKRPMNGFFGRLSSPTYTPEQKKLINDIQNYIFTQDEGFKDIDTVNRDYAAFIQRGRELFPATGAFPRLERMFHTGKDKSDIEIIKIPSELQKGGKRRRRFQTRRKRGRRTARR